MVSEASMDVEGYDRLAKFMGDEAAFAIFRRHAVLSAQNLLYYQAELQDLEEKLEKYRKEDRESGHSDRTQYAYDWDTLRASTSPAADEGNDSRQWKTWLEIRKKLKEYREKLLSASHLI